MKALLSSFSVSGHTVELHPHISKSQHLMQRTKLHVNLVPRNFSLALGEKALPAPPPSQEKVPGKDVDYTRKFRSDFIDHLSLY